MKHYFNI